MKRSSESELEINPAGENLRTRAYAISDAGWETIIRIHGSCGAETLRSEILRPEFLAGFQRICESLIFVCAFMFLCPCAQLSGKRAEAFIRLPKGSMTDPSPSQRFSQNLGLESERNFREGRQSLDPSVSCVRMDAFP